MTKANIDGYIASIPTLDAHDDRSITVDFHGVTIGGDRTTTPTNTSQYAATPKLVDMTPQHCGAHAYQHTAQLHKMLRLYLNAVLDEE